MEPIHVRMEPTQERRLRAWADEHGLTLSQATRALLEDKLSDMDKELPTDEGWRLSIIREVRRELNEKFHTRIKELILEAFK